MKKFYLLTKTLLVMALLSVGASNAWGQVTTTLLEYGTNDVPWTTGRVAEWTAGGSPTLADGIVTISGGNGGYATSKTISPAAGNIINLTAVWRGSSELGRYFSDGNGSYFRFGNIIVAQNDQDQKHGYVLTGLSNMSSVTKFTAGSYRVDVTSSTWLKIEAEINTATNTLTTFTIKSEDGATTYVNLSNQALTSPDYTTVAFGYKKGGSVSKTNKEQLKSIKITQTVPPTTYANYTVHFKDNNGATVKDDEVRNGEVGSTVNANSTDKESFYNGGYKYVYDNDGDGVEVVKAGTSEMTVTYTKYGQFTYNVYAVNSSDVKLQNDPIATATTYLTESATPAWSKYIKISGKWYVSSESTFTATATAAGSKNVVYTETDAIDYFFEFEELTKSGSFAATSSGDNLSNNNSARLGKSSRVWTTALAAGTYTLKIYCYGENAKSPTLSMYYCNTDGSNLVYIGEATAASASSWELKETTGIVIPEGKVLCLYNNDASNNSNYLADYITLKRTGDATVSKTISSTLGWGTYCSPYALDFSGSIANLTKAYLVTGGKDGQLELSDITGTIPANTGILLEGSGAVSIPVVASSLTDVSSNKLIGVTANTPGVAAGIYVLLNGADDVSGPVGFYKTANTFTIGANTAYLLAGFDSKGGGEARAAYFFGGITGISEAAQVVETALKDGKFIENGKLVIVKNGKKFNANGTEIK